MKKKNKLSDEIVFLTGEENQPVQQATSSNKKTGSKSTISEEVIVSERAKVEKTPSLKDALSKIDSIGKRGKDDASQEPIGEKKADNRPRNSFTTEQLSDSWSIFVERLKKSDVRMYVALKAIQPVLKEKDIIEINFQNNAQLEEYQLRLKPLLLSELKESFNNEYIQLTENIVEAENLERPKLLSDKEKLEQMIEKNPALQNLRNKFNLDFD